MNTYALSALRPAAPTPLRVHLLLARAFAGERPLRVGELTSPETGYHVVQAGVTSQFALVELEIPAPMEEAPTEAVLTAATLYATALEGVGAEGLSINIHYVAANWAGDDRADVLLRQEMDPLELLQAR